MTLDSYKNDVEATCQRFINEIASLIKQGVEAGLDPEMLVAIIALQQSKMDKYIEEAMTCV